jgi:hypothetical protein
MNNVVALCCGILISSKIDLKYKMALPASHAAVNSASVVESAMVSWYFVLYNIVPPANHSNIPVTDCQCLVSPPQSASTAACMSVGESISLVFVV